MADAVRAGRLWLATAFRAAPGITTVMAALGALEALSGPIQAYGVALVVNAVTASQPTSVVWGVAVVVAAFAASFLGLAALVPLETTLHDRVHGRLHRDLLDLTVGIPGVAHHERPEVADRLGLLRDNARSMAFSAGDLIFVVTALVNACTVLVLLAAVHPILLVLPVLGLARVWAATVSGRLEQQAAERTAFHARLVHRLVDIVESPRHGLEVRVFDLGPMLIERIKSAARHLRTERTRAAVRGGGVEGMVRFGFGLAYAAAILFVIGRARSGSATTGDVALVVLLAPQVDQAAGGVADQVRQAGGAIRMYARYVWLHDHARMHAWSDGRTTAPAGLRSGIEIRGVEFRYPETLQPVLRDINLTLPAGSVVALVGENGAGKTTIVKLLARLYDPTSGKVLVDGQDLREMSPRAWRSRISAAFQDFVPFEFTAREVVGIGDLDRMEDEPAIREALVRGDAAGVIEQLPQGLDTPLGRRFTSGVDVSAGQWQRLALARGLMRKRPLLLLLDEPTAALDPEAEHALFERFAAQARAAADDTGGITLVVSHRFSTVRMADMIVVLHQGRVVETGTHTQLVNAGGRYAELFELQARAYQ